MKMSILTCKACLLLVLAARSCSSFFAPPDNCGTICRSRCDSASRSVYGGGRCIESRHSSALVKRRSHLRITPVEQLDFETGEVMNSFPSVIEAARALGIRPTGISCVLRGVCKSSGGFFWRRAGDDAMPSTRTYRGIPIEQVDMETGKVINVFPSAGEAARSLGIRRNAIARIVNGGIDRISYKGYLWREVGDKKTVPRKQKLPPVPRGKQKVEQIDYGTGAVLAVFDSINEAAVSLNIPSQKIRATITGLQKSTRGFTFRKIGKPIPYKKSLKRRPVEQLCLETGNVLATYHSLKAAGNAVGVSAAAISSAATGIDSKSSAGYAWRFVVKLET